MKKLIFFILLAIVFLHVTARAQEVRMNITTSEACTCRYSTTDQDYDLMENTMPAPGSDSNSHSVELDLATGTTYTYYIRCKDTSDNKNSASIVQSFTLPADGYGMAGTGPKVQGYGTQRKHTFRY